MKKRIRTRQRSDVVEQIEESAQCKFQKRDTRVEFLHSGSIMFNLALSQKAVLGGWGRSRIGNLVGDGSSGKTLCALEACAQAFYGIQDRPSELFPPVKKVHIVYWNREGVMDFPLDVMYGNPFVDGVEWVSDITTIEAWGRDVFRRIDAHRPGHFFLGVLDSIDSMGSESGEERLNKSIKTDKPMDGSYGTGPEKAKYLSADFFNNVCGRMHGKDITFILISQVRENIDKVLFGPKYRRACGKALDFYTHQVAWLAEYGRKLTKTYQGDERPYGYRIAAKIKRNKCALRDRIAVMPVINDFGIDDVSGMLDFLFGPSTKAGVFGGEQMSKEELLEQAQDDYKMYNSLVEAVEEKWYLIEQKTRVERKPKFQHLR